MRPGSQTSPDAGSAASNERLTPFLDRSIQSRFQGRELVRFMHIRASEAPMSQSMSQSIRSSHPALGALLLATVVACNPSDRPEPGDAREAVQSAADRTEQGMKNAAHEAGEVADAIADEAREAGRDVREGAREAGRDVRADMDEAGDAMALKTEELQRELGQTKEDFAAASERRLAKADRELDKLEAQAEGAGQEARADLREARAELDTFAARVETASEETWQDAKGDFAVGLARLEASIREARRELEAES